MRPASIPAAAPATEVAADSNVADASLTVETTLAIETTLTTDAPAATSSSCVIPNPTIPVADTFPIPATPSVSDTTNALSICTSPVRIAANLDRADTSLVIATAGATANDTSPVPATTSPAPADATTSPTTELADVEPSIPARPPSPIPTAPLSVLTNEKRLGKKDRSQVEQTARRASGRIAAANDERALPRTRSGGQHAARSTGAKSTGAKGAGTKSIGAKRGDGKVTSVTTTDKGAVGNKRKRK